jgi:hypothetical protein
VVPAASAPLSSMLIFKAKWDTSSINWSNTVVQAVLKPPCLTGPVRP